MDTILRFKRLAVITMSIILVLAIAGYEMRRYYFHDEYADAIPVHFEWKRYRDEIQKYEVDYPDFTAPAVERDLNLYATEFGREFTVEADAGLPPGIATIEDAIRTPPAYLRFDRKITIDGYAAAVFKPKAEAGGNSPDIVGFIAYGRWYAITVLHQQNEARILDSFKVLK